MEFRDNQGQKAKRESEVTLVLEDFRVIQLKELPVLRAYKVQLVKKVKQEDLELLELLAHKVRKVILEAGVPNAGQEIMVLKENLDGMAVREFQEIVVRQGQPVPLA